MDIKDFGQQIEQLTVADIAEKTHKSERYVKSHLARNGISCADYHGEARKAEFLQRLAEEERKASLEKPAVRRAGQSVSEVMVANKKESDNLFVTVFFLYGVVWFLMTLWGFGANGAAFFLFWLFLSFGLFVAGMMTWSSLSDSAEKNRLSKMSATEKSSYIATKNAISEVHNEVVSRFRVVDLYGVPNVNLVCPHCQTKGQVRSKLTEEVASTKVVPIIGNKIKTRKKVTQMHCDNCNITWHV